MWTINNLADMNGFSATLLYACIYKLESMARWRNMIAKSRSSKSIHIISIGNTSHSDPATQQ